MSRIDDLIKEHCPDGVEFKSTGKAVIIANNKRKPVKSSLRTPGTIPYYGANNIQDYVEGFTHEGNYVLIAEDGSASLDNYSIQYAEGKFWANNHVHVIKGNKELKNRFLFHYLRSMNFRPYLSGGERAKLTKAKLLEITIPIPPLPVQQEIVDILDAFTKLEAELEAELTARKKQYNYFRDRLLTFEKGAQIPFIEKLLDGAAVAWVPVDELFHLKNGYTPSKSKKEFWEGGSIPWFRMDDIRQNGRLLDDSLQKITEAAVKGGKLFSANSMIFATSATIGEHALIAVSYLANQRFTNLAVKEEYTEIVDIRYLYYYGFLLSDWCKKNTTISSFSSVDMDGFRKFEIPIPCPENPQKSLAIQGEIVRILDKFDTLTNSISEGLPREIALRQKQYEYYRNLLLNFPKPEEAAT